MKIKICFIIAHRYVRGYNYYLPHYISNIRNYYNNDALIIIVDNNSVHKDEALDVYKNNKDIIILDNNSDSKFEAGAYTVAVNYILTNNILKKYDYYAFTQDTYILKNYYNFDELKENNVMACPISYACGHQDIPFDMIKPYLECMNILNDNLIYNIEPITKLEHITDTILSKVLHCYCSVFVINQNKINELYSYINKLKLTVRFHSELFERYFAFALFKMNNYKNYQIDFNPYSLYDQWNINLLDDFNHGFFAKHQQRKRENTIDKF